MKKIPFTSKYIGALPMLVAILFSNVLFAQLENQDYSFNDESEIETISTSEFSITTPLIQNEKKAKSSVKIFAGASFNDFSNTDDLESNVRTGFMLGASYKRGRFFYYEIGARFNYREFELGSSTSESNTFGTSAIDVPITGGINLTSYIDKLIGVRIFISAVPSFVLGIENDNTAGFEKDDLNSFVMGGQAGIGIDIAFFFIEGGYNYGFTDIMKDYSSNLSQAFVGIGFRF